jgi:hypothetical protein
MSDPSTEPVEVDPNSEIKAELTRSLNSIWSRHNGGKPSSCDTELKGDSVKFVMHDAVSGIGADADETADGDAPTDEPVGSPDSVDYRNEAIAAVRRITKRNVRGFIPKRNKKTDEASDTYILEQIHRPQ